MDGLQLRLRYAPGTIDKTDMLFLASLLLDFEGKESWMADRHKKVKAYDRRRADV